VSVAFATEPSCAGTISNVAVSVTSVRFPSSSMMIACRVEVSVVPSAQCSCGESTTTIRRAVGDGMSSPPPSSPRSPQPKTNPHVTARRPNKRTRMRACTSKLHASTDLGAIIQYPMFIDG
jgi:hypothetical protein